MALTGKCHDLEYKNLEYDHAKAEL